MMNLSLHIGERIQLCKGGICFDSRLIGAISGVSLLVANPVREGLRIDFLEGEKVEARLFTGRDVCFFDAGVDHVCIAPIHYLHLGYPEEFKIQPLRHTPWVRLKEPAMALAGGETRPVLMTNLSEEGAQIESPGPVGGKGDSIRLAFQAEIDGMKRRMELEARIAHAHLGNGMILCGLSFQDESDDERIWLKCLVYRGIAEGRLI